MLSELRRRRPDSRVVQWFEARPAAALHLSVLTLGELRKGMQTIEDIERRHKLIDWLETELPIFFAGRILPIDAKTADRWGRLMAQVGRPLPAIDSLLAATALTHDLTLVTRNARDFAFENLALIDPWQETAGS